MTTILEDNFIKILTAFLLIIVTSISIFVWKKCSASKTSILMLGLTGAGKTYFYSWLVHKKDKITYTSMKENLGEFTNERNHNISIVDIPGYQTITYQILEKYKSNTNGIIFMIDSYEFSKNYRDVANYLYNVVTDKQIINKRIPLLIICNKQDLPLAKNSGAIKSILEKEFELLKLTKTALPNQGKAKSMQDTEHFTFANIHNNISFVESQKPGFEGKNIYTWLNKF